MIKFTVNLPKGALERLTAALQPVALDRVVDRVALQTLTSVVTATPKRWFGQVRRSWQMQKPAIGVRRIQNDNKIMLWLEEGTKDHGTNPPGRMLYIPLTRAASFGYKPGMKFGVDFILKKRVKGIQARHIARDEAVKAEKLLLASMKAHIKAAIA